MSSQSSGYAISQAIVVGQPDFRKSCWEVIDELKAQGSTFLVTSDKPSHLLRFCDRAILLDAGSIVADTTVDDALERLREISIHARHRALVLVGDSITQAWQTEGHEELLRPYRTVNLGTSGDRTEQKIGRAHV